jgi:hypothetical protein
MAIRYVNPSGSNTSPYDTEAKAATTIQTALTGAVSEDVIAVRDDADYVLAATLSVPNVGTIFMVAYKTTSPTTKLFDGDMSDGGAFYKTARVTIDNDNLAQSAITYLGNTQLYLLNFEITNVPVTHPPIDWTTNGTVAVEGVGCGLHNCHITGGRYMDFTIVNNPLIFDSKFTGSWFDSGGKSYFPCLTLLPGGLVANNFFKIDAGEGYLSTNSNAGADQDMCPTVMGNIFTLGGNIDKEMIRARHGGNFVNNTFYQPAGFIMGEGQGDNIMLSQSKDDLFYFTIWNNIFFSAATGASIAQGINISDPTKLAFIHNYNCLYNTDNTNYVLGLNDIEEDPLFEDAPNDNFTLKPGSPCLNAGQPSLAGDDIFAKSTIGSYQRGLVNNNELRKNGINLQYGKSNKQYGP